MDSDLQKIIDLYPTNTIVPSIEELLSDKRIKFYIPEIKHSVPKTFDGRIAWNGALTPSIDQGSCGSCWAFAAVSCLSDKFNIQSMGQMYVELSPTRILLCSLPNESDLKNWITKPNSKDLLARNVYALTKAGCYGSTLYTAWDFLYIWGTNTLKCAPYEGLSNFKDISNLPLCTSFFGLNADMCSDYKYWEKGDTEIGTPARFYRCENYYYIPGISQLGGKIEYLEYSIYTYGPIAGNMDIYPNFYTFDPKNDIYDWDGKGTKISGHAVEIVGWGEKDNKQYWIIKNFWGTGWGMNGYFYMVKGKNSCNIENYGVSGAPDFFYPIGYDPTIGITSEGELSKSKRFAVENRLTILNGGIDSQTGYSRRLLRNMPWIDKSRVIDISTLPDFSTWIAGLDATPEKRVEYKKYIEKIKDNDDKNKQVLYLSISILLLFFILIFLSIIKKNKNANNT